MVSQKFILVGKNSFLSQNFSNFLISKKINFLKIGFKKFLNLNDKKINNYSAVLNFSTNKRFYKEKYNSKYDFDLKIAKKIKSLNIKLVIFSTGKVYKSSKNLKENSLKKPQTTYGKNKLLSENNIKKNISNYLILRVSNIIGNRIKKNKTNVTNTFFDILRNNLKKKKIEIPKKNFFKDFIFIDDFCIILHTLLKKNLKGTYNFSSGKRVYLHRLAKIISKITKIPIFYKNEITDSFTLNNSKLLKHANINYKFKKINPKNIKKYI